MSHIHCLIYMLIWKFEQSIAILFRILYTLTSPVSNRILVGTAEPRFTITIAGTSDDWNRGFVILAFRLPAQTSPPPSSCRASATSLLGQTVHDTPPRIAYHPLPQWSSGKRRQVFHAYDRWREKMLQLSCYFPLSRTPECFNFLAMVWKHPPSLVGRTCIAGSGGPSLYGCRDRRCADRQSNPVIDEG